MPTVSEVLYKTADVIEQRGWINQSQADALGIKDTWGRDGGPVCIEGALMAVLDVPYACDMVPCPAYSALHAYLEVTPGLRLYDWNDETEYDGSGGWTGRTQAEVVEVLRACAVIEAVKESARTSEAAKVEVAVR